MADHDSEDDLFAIILRRDGSLRYDRVCRDRLEELFPKTVIDDPGMQAIISLCVKGVFHPLREALGNVGMDSFSHSRSRIASALESGSIDNSHFSEPFTSALKHSLAELEDRIPRAAEAENLVQDPDGAAKILSDIIDLETDCQLADQNDGCRKRCRAIFWKLWEFAWARRIFVVEDYVIEILENIYATYAFLENREGKRRKLKPPGGMIDPREGSNDPEVWK